MGTVCASWWAKFIPVDGGPMPWWARTFSPCYHLYLPLFYFIIRPRNRRKRTFWCHGSHRVSIPLPDSMFSFLAILTTAGPSGGHPGRLLGPFYSLSMHILSGEGLGMRVIDNLSPIPILVHWQRAPCSQVSQHKSPPLHTSLYHSTHTPLAVEGASPVEGTLSHTPINSPYFPTPVEPSPVM